MKRQVFARTKIVCTLGPSSNTASAITGMLREGMDAARFNFSHGALREHVEMLRLLKRCARSVGISIATIQDLQGPKIRIGVLPSPVVLRQKQIVTLSPERSASGNQSAIPTTYAHLSKDVTAGDRLLIDDGRIELRVARVSRGSVAARVIVGGTVASHKGINLPGVAISVPSLTEKDKQDLQFAFDHDVDYVALSFVRHVRDIFSLRRFIEAHGPKDRHIGIIAKIEKGEAIQQIDDIIREADAVMVARGDLGVELPTEDVPLLQKMIVRKCNEAGKPVIIATQMLESMLHNPSPTRAEASDVANAVLDGADAVMLSGETSVGQYPVQAVEIMNRIIRKTEAQAAVVPVPSDPEMLPLNHPYDPLSLSACKLAGDIRASTIVTLTHSGETALRVAKFRPSANAVAVTDDETVVRRLHLVWGIRGIVVDNLKKDTDTVFRMIERKLLAEGCVHRGETIVVLSGIPLFEEHSTNTITVNKV